jgi:hypothetical protein
MEHMISDAASIQIFLRDVFTMYAQSIEDRAISLPNVGVQFPDYAVWQRSSHQAWLEEHGAYWSGHYQGCSRVRFPVSESTPTQNGWGCVPICIGKELRRQLVEWCHRRQITLVMAVFAAYAGLVLRWCAVPEAVIGYQSDGRATRRCAETIGYFACRLYLRICILEDDDFNDLLRNIVREYCDACEHNDVCYMESQQDPPGFTKNSYFNWVPQASAPESTLGSLRIPLETRLWPYVDPWPKRLDWDNEPMVLLYDTGEETRGGVYFPRKRFSVDCMEQFARNFLVFVHTLLKQPEGCVKDVGLVP